MNRPLMFNFNSKFYKKFVELAASNEMKPSQYLNFIIEQYLKNPYELKLYKIHCDIFIGIYVNKNTVNSYKLIYDDKYIGLIGTMKQVVYNYTFDKLSSDELNLFKEYTPKPVLLKLNDKTKEILAENNLIEKSFINFLEKMVGEDNV